MYRLKVSSHASKLFFMILFVSCELLATVNAQTKHETVDFSKFSSSLDFVPSNASFYWSINNNDLKLKAVFESQAFKEFSETRVAQALWKSFQDGFRQGLQGEIDDEDMNDLLTWIASEDGKDTLAVFQDAFSKEVFLFGDEHWSDALTRAMSFYGKAFQYGMANPDPDEEEVQRMIWNMASKEFADMQIPAMLVGGKLSDPARAKKLLGRIHDLLAAEIANLPEDQDFLKNALTKIDTADGLSLVLNMKGDEIPWDKMSNDWELEEAELQQIKDWWKDKSISISLRVVGNYLFFGSAPNEEFFAELGQGKLLVDSSVFEPFRKHHDQTVSSIAYLSNEFVAQATNSVDIGEYYSNLFEGIRRESDDFDGNSELAEAIEGDIAEFSKDFKEFLPDPGAYLSFSFLIEQGIEGYSYDWSENLNFDGSKQLTILDHVDGEPAILIAGRSKSGYQEYDFVAKYVKRVMDRVIEFGPDTIDDSDKRDEFLTIVGDIRDFLSSLHRTNREKLLPSLEDGQSAILVDFKQEQNSWFALMPPADDPIPIPSIAILAGVSDSELFKSALRDYFQTADAIVELLQSNPDANVPSDFVIPRPEREPLEDGMIYFYTIPDELGLNGEIIPNMSLNRDFVIFSLTPSQSRRLLAPTPLNVGGPLQDTKRPLMFAVHYNNRATIEAVEEWGNYLLQLWLGFVEPEDFSQLELSPALLTALINNPGGQDTDEPGTNVDNVDDLDDLDAADFIEFGEKSFALLKCFDSFTAAGYIEDDAMVTHFLFRFKDIHEN